MAHEVRSLILERLPLFLHEHTHAATRVPFSWLNNEKNFIVRTFGKVTVKRSLNFSGAKSSKSIETSAIARREGKGAIQLWLAGNAQVDMYEVATSLCRLLFDTYRVNDALLFMTILSTDLRALRRRGYNGDWNDFFPSAPLIRSTNSRSYPETAESREGGCRRTSPC